MFVVLVCAFLCYLCVFYVHSLGMCCFFIIYTVEFPHFHGRTDAVLESILISNALYCFRCVSLLARISVCYCHFYENRSQLILPWYILYLKQESFFYMFSISLSSKIHVNQFSNPA